VTDELRENLEFALLEVQTREVAALAFFAALVSAMLAVAVLLLSISVGLQALNFLPITPMPLLTYTFIWSYPKLRAERQRIRGLGEFPVLINYLTMSMRVTPNLERATAFAAENVEGPLGTGLKDTLRRTCLRAHPEVGEALSSFAERWGKWCEDLKRSIYLLRSSVSERAEAARLQTLDRALELSLRGARDRMRDFAAGLHLPTLLIYSMGVLLPLVLVAILPVLSIINISIGVPQIFVIYCVVLPLAVYILSHWALAKRPATFPPPKVPIEIDRARALLSAGLLATALVGAGLLSQAADEIRAILFLWAPTLGVVLYLHLTTAQAFERRGRVERMEREFCDSLVQLGNRVSEGRPAEDALEHVANTMRGSEVEGLFTQASANIRLGGMGLRASLFDPERGALRGVHSKMIHSVLRLLIDVIERSTRVAGAAILRTADHLRELKQVELDIRRSLGEIVTSMRSVALFFAPFIAAIAARMQGLLASKTASVGFLGSGTGVSSAAFLFVLGLYVVLLTAILMSYAVEIELGNDPLAKRAVIARGLPVALGVFTAGAAVGGQMLSAIIG
jgi:Flp pilus assembly protein TadB